MSLRIVLAEDAVLMREGLVGLLERFGHVVVAAVGDADALVAAVREHRPDLVVTDVRMPPACTAAGFQGSLPTPATTAVFSASGAPSGHWCTQTRPGGTKVAGPKKRRICSRVRPAAWVTSVRR